MVGPGGADGAPGEYDGAAAGECYRADVMVGCDSCDPSWVGFYIESTDDVCPGNAKTSVEVVVGTVVGCVKI